jgi:DNA polymerase II large subunit
VTELEHELPPHSISYEQYFDSLNQEITRIYAIAEEARSKGFDPTVRVEIPPAHDVAARVEATLEGPKGVAKRIRELSHGGKSREDVAFAVAREIALGELGNQKERVTTALEILQLADSSSIGDKELTEAINTAEAVADKAVRVALAILTESITAAPLEGISKVKIRGSGNQRYLALYLAGPIRAAGGTEAAMTVLVADYVRQALKLPPLESRPEETERALEEVELYARNVHLQYPVHPELILFAADKLPIMLTGEPTEDFEVSGGRDLERIETNHVRGGSVLVLSDGVVGRATKLAKIVHDANIQGWEWLDELAARISKAKALEVEDSADKKLEPKYDYLSDVIGGRPVFSHPSRPGGFRLRYGRSRNTGLAGVGIHPATMYILEEFLATGTHIRTERPGKGSIVAPVDTIEGPIVLFKDGSVTRFSRLDDARGLEGKVKRILFLGDILVALGEFLENNHPLVPSGYCEEWWSHDLEHAISPITKTQLAKKLAGSGLTWKDIDEIIEFPLSHIPSPHQAFHLSKKLKIPLHPFYLYRWSMLSLEEIQVLRDWMLGTYKIEEMVEGERILLPSDKRNKSLLEKVGIPHRFTKDKKRLILIDEPVVILAQIGNLSKLPKGDITLDFLNSVSLVPLKDKTGFSIGARMGRPEKAEARKMKPPVQVLFPVGRSRGTERRMEEVAKNVQYISTLDTFDENNYTGEIFPQVSGVEVELVTRSCPNCGHKTYESRCSECGTHTEIEMKCSVEGCDNLIDPETNRCPNNKHLNPRHRTTKIESVDLKAKLDLAKAEVGELETHGVRGVLGLTNNNKIPEYLGKGILRAKHDVYCYRDGTARFDATDAPLTHFTPKEITVSVGRLRELGYVTDYNGVPLTSENQIVELKVQDIIISEKGGDYILRVGRFVDDCLEKIYGLKRYYNFNLQEDVIGQLVIGLAPHTSAGIIGRIIGFTNASVCYAHPYWHAAKRRNCDGDEDALILVLDGLLNFSKHYLPAGRGGLMDAPLVLSVILNPKEVDDESHNMEVCRRYPAKFYDLVAHAQHPNTVKRLVDIVATRLNTPAQYEGFGFTHNTTTFDAGPRNSRYKLLNSMDEKLEAQLRLATLIDAVDSQDVAQRVLSTHFFRDIRGNLRAYSTQKFRCMKCNRIYRRVPLSGKCNCGEAKLSLTVRERNISKYLAITEKIIHDHGLDDYMQERLKLINTSMDSLFVSKQTTLTDFFDD